MTKVAKALLYNNENKILVMIRSDSHPKFAGEIDLPGGTVGEGEPYYEAVIREVLEETGVDISSNKSLKLVYKYISHSGDDRHVYALKINDTNPDIKISWEHKKAYWIKPSDLIESKNLFSKDDYMIKTIEYLKTTL